jgi:hypothetical protein
LAGSFRNISKSEIIVLLEKSWLNDDLLTLKLIFWVGDIRGRAGKKRFFKLALKWLEQNYSQVLIKNIEFFNRWDSMFELVENSEVTNVVLNQVEKSLENKDDLLAKWLPRKKQYNDFKKLVQ